MYWGGRMKLGWGKKRDCIRKSKLRIVIDFKH